jgi:hypothetical protein
MVRPQWVVHTAKDGRGGVRSDARDRVSHVYGKSAVASFGREHLGRTGRPMTVEARWERVIAEWCDVVVLDEQWHTAQAARYARWDTWLGIPTVALAAITGTTAFAGLAVPGTYINVITGGASMVVAALAAVHSSAGPARKHESHVQYVARCRALRLELSFRRSFVPRSKSEAEAVFSDLRRLFSDIPPRLVAQTVVAEPGSTDDAHDHWDGGAYHGYGGGHLDYPEDRACERTELVPAQPAADFGITRWAELSADGSAEQTDGKTERTPPIVVTH